MEGLCCGRVSSLMKRKNDGNSFDFTEIKKKFEQIISDILDGISDR